MLDTGATWNILNTEVREGQSLDQVMWESDNILEYAYFKIGRENFGPIVFHRFPIQIPIRVEAILGMDFFQDRPVFLDFANRAVYFGKSGVPYGLEL